MSDERHPDPGLLAALGIRPGEVVALVGGGGKTGLAYRLLEEAHRQGWSVLFTTTTRVFAPDAEDGACFVGEPDCGALRRQLLAERRLFLARRWLDEWEDTPSGRRRKVEGFSPSEMAAIVNNLQPDLTLVEADGSRHRPFKAPAEYEPVVPPTTTLFLVVAGLSVLGQPLDPVAVHRPEQVARLSGVPLGAVVDADLVATVLLHPQGGRKGLPPTARAAAALTQVTAQRRPAGRALARRLLGEPSFDRVLLADLASGLAETWRRDEQGGAVLPPGGGPRVPAVVLAAGRSRRMGQNKLLLPLAGKPLLAHAVDAALGSLAAEVWVVLGARAETIRRALGKRPVRFLENPRWAEGQATSLQAALERLPDWSAGVLFLAGDMPLVSAVHLDRLIGHWGPAAVVWSGYGEGRGIPALFGSGTFPAFQGLRGDGGGRMLAGRFPETVVTAPFPPLDVDTPADYEEVRRRLEGAAERPQEVEL